MKSADKSGIMAQAPRSQLDKSAERMARMFAEPNPALAAMDDCTWRGKRIAKLSREELEAAFYQLANQYQRLISPGNSRAYALGRVEMVKRGEA